ncbi:MAG TPA: hypothetical protein DEQ09_12615 [Bacteroidales bacterium]|nr:hypothetical protein [Bacteroidales bacterium]
MNLETIFKKLWIDYSNLNPNAERIHKLLENEGEKIINDHIAFRTFDTEGINIDAITRVFIKMGYIGEGEYFFEKRGSGPGTMNMYRMN